MAKTQTIETAGIRIAYKEYGPAEGTPVLLLHGFPDGPNGWEEVAERLQPGKRKLRLLVPAQRGYGETTVLQENLLGGQEAALALDVLLFVDALGLERFGIIGHDWGARAGFNVSALAPHRVMFHLGLSSPWRMYGGRDLPPEQVERYWYQWFFQTAQGEKALRTDAKSLCEHIWRVWSPGWKFSRRELEETAAFWNNPQFAPVTLGSYRHRYGNALGLPAYQALQDRLEMRPKIEVPTLFGYGTDDHCVLPAASEDERRLFGKNYDRVAIKGVGHFPHRENPGAVVKLFDKVWAKSGPGKVR